MPEYEYECNKNIFGHPFAFQCKGVGKEADRMHVQINCAKRLDHKHIAKLVDVVAHDGRLALAVSLCCTLIIIFQRFQLVQERRTH